MPTSRQTIALTLNGEPTSTRAPDLASLLQELGLDETRIVTEINGVIIAKDRYRETRLGQGDQVELVRFVGGG